MANDWSSAIVNGPYHYPNGFYQMISSFCSRAPVEDATSHTLAQNIKNDHYHGIIDIWIDVCFLWSLSTHCNTCILLRDVLLSSVC